MELTGKEVMKYSQSSLMLISIFSEALGFGF